MLLWRWIKEVAENVLRRTPPRVESRFMATVFFAANDAVLVPWTRHRPGAENHRRGNQAGYYMTLAPLVADGR